MRFGKTLRRLGTMSFQVRKMLLVLYKPAVYIAKEVIKQNHEKSFLRMQKAEFPQEFGETSTR
jgi:hypothetical protein